MTEDEKSELYKTEYNEWARIVSRMTDLALEDSLESMESIKLKAKAGIDAIMAEIKKGRQ